MAIVNSLAVGKATKTAGELTYAKVRGRTIARRRIISNKSNTARQEAQRFTFGVVSSMAALIDPYIKQNFEPTEYGSARNCFMKRNWPYLKEGYQTDNPAEMTMATVLFDLINSGAYLQYGVNIEGSIKASFNEQNNIVYDVDFLDKGYSSVDVSFISYTNDGFLITPNATKLTLNNGVWSLHYVGTRPYTAGGFGIICIFVDGKPIANNTGAIIKTE